MHVVAGGGKPVIETQEPPTAHRGIQNLAENNRLTASLSLLPLRDEVCLCTTNSCSLTIGDSRSHVLHLCPFGFLMTLREKINSKATQIGYQGLRCVHRISKVVWGGSRAPSC